MTQFLPPNLLALFAPREPIPFLPPASKLPHEKKTRGYVGVGAFLAEFEDPAETPPPTRVETREERVERRRRERAEQVAYKLEQEIAVWDPNTMPNVTGDPFKTLFVARINYDTSESKLRREFEVYGPIKKIVVIHNTVNGKPRGYAFIEYEHERDMHSAYKHADGKKIDSRRVLVDVERARTVKGWLPRRLGGGLGGTRRGGPEVNIKHSGREDNERERERYRLEREREERGGRGGGGGGGGGGDRDRDRSLASYAGMNDRRRSRSPRERRKRSRSPRDRKRSRRSSRDRRDTVDVEEIEPLGGGGGGGGSGRRDKSERSDRDKERSKRRRSRSRDRERKRERRERRGDRGDRGGDRGGLVDYIKTDGEGGEGGLGGGMVRVKEEPADDYPDYHGGGGGGGHHSLLGLGLGGQQQSYASAGGASDGSGGAGGAGGGSGSGGHHRVKYEDDDDDEDERKYEPADHHANGKRVYEDYEEGEAY